MSKESRQFSMSPSRLPCRHDYDPPLLVAICTFFDFLFNKENECGVFFRLKIIIRCIKKYYAMSYFETFSRQCKKRQYCFKKKKILNFNPCLLRNNNFISQIPLCIVNIFYSVFISNWFKNCYFLFYFFFGGDDDNNEKRLMSLSKTLDFPSPTLF